MKVMSSLPEQTKDLSLLDFFLKRFFIIFIADIKTDDGEVVEEEEEFEDSDDIKDEVDGDNLKATEDLLLSDTSSLDLSLPEDLRVPLLRRNSFIGPDKPLEDAFGSALSPVAFTVMGEHLLGSSNDELDVDEMLFAVVVICCS